MNRKQIAKYCVFLLLFMEVSFAARRSLALLLRVSTEEQSTLPRIRNELLSRGRRRDGSAPAWESWLHGRGGAGGIDVTFRTPWTRPMPCEEFPAELCHWWPPLPRPTVVQHPSRDPIHLQAGHAPWADRASTMVLSQVSVCWSEMNWLFSWPWEGLLWKPHQFGPSDPNPKHKWEDLATSLLVTVYPDGQDKIWGKFCAVVLPACEHRGRCHADLRATLCR